MPHPETTIAKGPEPMSMTGEIKTLNKSAFHLLRRASQFAADLYAEEIGDSDLTHRQFTVLLTISQHEGLSQTALVEHTGIDRSTLADLVARLSNKNLIQRRRAKEDGRANTIRLSAAGRRALVATQPAAASVDKRLLGLLSPAQRREFLAALNTISDALDERTSEGANGR